MQTETLWGPLFPAQYLRQVQEHAGGEHMALPLREPHVLWGLVDAVGGRPHLPDMGGAVEYVTRCRSPHVTSGLHP